MDDQLNFETFFRERVKEKGLSLKKLADLTGISQAHLENMARGDFESMPSAPYFHGYLVRLSKVLDFDAEEWWEEVKKEQIVKNSGPADALPRNRFVKKSPAKFIMLGAVAVLVFIYAAVQIPRSMGKPAIAITFPPQNPYAASSSMVTLEGTVKNADALYLNGDPVTINVSDHTWQKSVLLQNGMNTFDLVARKFLGGQTDITEQIIYQAPAAASPSSSATGAPSSSFPGTINASTSTSSPVNY
ncbi:MAG: helix-turn-helix domain-containing protein [Patescibacteria group bacterium]|nr:helix-turn-helix domain-containing protein [Patescibacteria group bacterium]